MKAMDTETAALQTLARLVAGCHEVDCSSDMDRRDVAQFAETLSAACAFLQVAGFDYCRHCGCSQEDSCDGGCFWIERKPGGLCSECARALGRDVTLSGNVYHLATPLQRAEAAVSLAHALGLDDDAALDMATSALLSQFTLTCRHDGAVVVRDRSGTSFTLRRRKGQGDAVG
jgi:hypothetical protein